MVKIIYSVITIILATTIGCAQGNCRQNRKTDEATEMKKAEALLKETGNAGRIKVYKYDGSKQCGMGKAISIDDMKKDLGNIPVHSSENKPDGLMHIQMCGAPTGRANVYEIDQIHKVDAIAKGFKEWIW